LFEYKHWCSAVYDPFITGIEELLKNPKYNEMKAKLDNTTALEDFGELSQHLKTFINKDSFADVIFLVGPMVQILVIYF
jgi:hypothetical protein